MLTIERTAELAAFVQCGIVESSPLFDELASQGGREVNMPSGAHSVSAAPSPPFVEERARERRRHESLNYQPAPVITGAITEFGGTEPGRLDVTLNFSFDHGSFSPRSTAPS